MEQLTPTLREQVLKHELKWRHQTFSVKVVVSQRLMGRSSRLCSRKSWVPLLILIVQTSNTPGKAFALSAVLKRFVSGPLICRVCIKAMPLTRVMAERRERMSIRELVKMIKDILQEEEELRFANPFVEEVAVPSPEATWSEDTWSKAEPRWPRRPSDQ